MVQTRSSGLEVLKRRPIGQPHRPRTRYCSIGFQPVSSVHGTEARQARPFLPMVKNTRSSGLEVLKGRWFQMVDPAPIVAEQTDVRRNRVSEPLVALSEYKEQAKGYPVNSLQNQTRRTGCFHHGQQRVLPGELPSRGRSIQAGSLCYTNGCAVDVVARLDASSASPAEGPGAFHHGSKGLAWRASAPWTFDNRLEAYATLTGARSMWLADWTPLQHLQPGGPGVFHHGHKGSCLASFRPVDARYRLEAYATITGARSRWLPDWTPLQHLQPKDRVFFTMGAKGLGWRASASWRWVTGYQPMLQ